MLAHLACRAPLLISLSPIPATGLSALSGLSSSLPCTTGFCRQLSAWTGRASICGGGTCWCFDFQLSFHANQDSALYRDQYLNELSSNLRENAWALVV